MDGEKDELTSLMRSLLKYTKKLVHIHESESARRVYPQSPVDTISTAVSTPSEVTTPTSGRRTLPAAPPPPAIAFAACRGCDDFSCTKHWKGTHDPTTDEDLAVEFLHAHQLTHKPSCPKHGKGLMVRREGTQHYICRGGKDRNCRQMVHGCGPWLHMRSKVEARNILRVIQLVSQKHTVRTILLITKLTSNTSKTEGSPQGKRKRKRGRKEANEESDESEEEKDWSLRQRDLMGSLRDGHCIDGQIIHHAIDDDLADGFFLVPSMLDKSTHTTWVVPPSKMQHTLIWPLFYEGHYVLLVVDMKRKELECYDSLRSYAHTQRSNTLAVVRALITSAVKSNVKKEVYKGCQQQERGSNDCGIHVINNALAVMCPGTNLGHDRKTLRKLVRESDEESWDINPCDYD